MEKIEIKDLYLAAYLKCKNVPLESFKLHQRYAIFEFQNSEDVGELIQQYIKDQASVNIKAFRNCLRDLKSLASGDIPTPKADSPDLR